ncbi:tyrosine-type recombinase/integrase [Salmonella enterica]|nr:tyrosine-type recombinase/integrase [Salmonella enterica]
MQKNDVPKIVPKFPLPNPSLKRRGNTYSIRAQLPSQILKIHAQKSSDVIVSLNRCFDLSVAQKLLKRVKVGFKLQSQICAETVSEYRFKLRGLILDLIDSEKSEQVAIHDLLRTVVLSQAKTDNPIFFKDWFQKYQSEKINSGEWSKGTEDTNQTTYNELAPYFKEKNLSSMTHDDFIKIRDDYFKDKLKAGKSKGEDTLKATVNLRLSKIIAFFKWLNVKGEISDNRAINIKYSDKRADNEKRGTFTNEQCYKILNAIHMGFRRSDNKRRTYGDDGERLAQQLIVLGVFTGARIAELQDLSQDDFLHDKNNNLKGIYIHGQIKNASSERLIPLGDFPDWFKLDVSLFRENRNDDYKYFTKKTLGKEVNKTIKMILPEALEHNLTFHSFRHSFETRASKYHDINPTHIDQITGHAFKDTGRKIYLAKNKNLDDIQHLFSVVNKINSVLLG